MFFNYDVASSDTLKLDYDFAKDYSLENIQNFFYYSPINIEVNNQQILLLPIKKQLFNICGSVRSGLDDNSFPFANVLVGNDQGGQSDAKGSFDFQIEAYKNEQVEISYLGYLPKIFTAQDFEECQNIALDLNEELISSNIIIREYLSRGISEGHEYGAFKFDLNQVKLKNEILERDVLKQVQLLPGIYSPDDSASNLNIRGSSSDHNLILWEGVNLYDNGHFFGMVSSVNPFQLKELKVYKSIHDPSFDNRIGGVIEMNLANKVDGPLSVSLGTNLTEAHANISIPFFQNKARIILGGRRSLFDLMEESPTVESYALKIFQGAQISEEEETEESMEQELEISYGDFNAKLIVEPNDKLKLQSSFLYSFDDFDYSYLIPTDEFISADTLNSNMLAFSNKISYAQDARNHTDFHVSYSSFTSNSYLRITDLADSKDFFEEELFNQISELSTNIKHQKSIGLHKIDFGYAYDQKSLENSYYEDSDFEPARESETFNAGKYHHLFVNDVANYDKLKLEFGARLTYASLQSNFQFSPRLSARYRLRPSLTLRMGAGIFNQYLRQLYESSESELNLSAKIWTLPEMDDSSILTSRKITAGAVFKKNNWLLDIEGYYHLTTGLSAENPTIRNQFILEDMGQLISSGVDILLSKRIKQFQSSLYYSLSSQLVYFSFYDDEEYFPANTDQRNVLSWSNKYSYQNWTLSGIYQYRTGLPYTIGENVSIVEDDDPEDNFEIELDGINDERLIDYHRIDMALQYQYQWKQINAEAGISILNLFNRENIQSRQYTLANTDESDAEPEVLLIEKYQLPRTLLMNLRVFF